MKKHKATKSATAMIVVALIAGAAVYLLSGKNSLTAQADGGATTEATAAAAGAHVLPTDPPLKVEPK